MRRAKCIRGAGVGRAALVLLAALAVAGCGREETPEVVVETLEVEVGPAGPDRDVLRARARAVFGSLPREVPNPDNPVTDAKVELGRALYYDVRLSVNHDVACNTCHLLDRFGVDGAATSSGHRAQRGDRNAPSVYNAALHIAQFWDGRAADVEEQAKGPPLNPVEMAMPSDEAIVAVLESIPGYLPLFAAAFPDAEPAITYDHMAMAIGAFERRLTTPGAFDAFLEGNDAALTDDQVAGLGLFMDTGCIICHVGPAIGGGLYQKLGLRKPYPTEDPGRAGVTGDDADRAVFKVPSLRNVARTGPYLHDGSVAELDSMIRIMGEYQLAVELDDTQVARLRAFLESLTGTVEASLVAMPELPASGPATPAPDPS